MSNCSMHPHAQSTSAEMNAMNVSFRAGAAIAADGSMSHKQRRRKSKRLSGKDTTQIKNVFDFRGGIDRPRQPERAVV
eukprot:3936864-Rhodomonas_salina.2